MRLGQHGRALEAGLVLLSQLGWFEYAWEESRKRRWLVVFSNGHVVLEMALLRAQFQCFPKVSVLFR